MEALADRLGRRFRNPQLLRRAMAHRSWCAETPGQESNERLEFLGDAVLGLVIADHIFRTYQLTEGELAKLRAWVVSAEVLAEVGLELQLERTLLLGKGERAQGGATKPSILADAVEAVIGAAYLDQGWDAAIELVLRLLGSRVEEAAPLPGGRDFKTRLQELAARLTLPIPRYETASEGPDHAKVFFAVVSVGQHRFDGGTGPSKKAAEQTVAARAWRELHAALNLDDPSTASTATAVTAPTTVVGGATGPGFVSAAIDNAAGEDTGQQGAASA